MQRRATTALALLLSLGVMIVDAPARLGDVAMYEEAAMPYHPEDGVEDAQSPVAAALARHQPALMAIDGVVGVGVGRNAIGDDAIIVYVRDGSVRRRLPPSVERYPLEAVVTGDIDALREQPPR